MARTKKAEDDTTIQLDSSKFTPAEVGITEKLNEAFEKVITRDFGHTRAPEPYITPFGIQHLDGLLGGGIISSSPVVLSSTPETGKSTFAFQFSKTFQLTYPNSIIVYLDIEGAANASGAGNANDNRISRIHIFGIDRNRFRYEPMVIDVYGFFNMIEVLVNIKKQFEEQLQKEFKVMIIWDSIAATPCSKLYEVADPNKIIGLRECGRLRVNCWNFLRD
jgi:predicted ATP-dependent serine protease